jgi:hypothetical protein
MGKVKVKVKVKGKIVLVIFLNWAPQGRIGGVEE